VPIADDQTLAALVASIGVLDQEAVDLRFDGCLEHLAGSFTNDLVESAPGFKRFPELDHFRVDCLLAGCSRWCPERC
jgi:hypothetical protein